MIDGESYSFYQRYILSVEKERLVTFSDGITVEPFEFNHVWLLVIGGMSFTNSEPINSLENASSFFKKSYTA